MIMTSTGATQTHKLNDHTRANTINEIVFVSQKTLQRNKYFAIWCVYYELNSITLDLSIKLVFDS